MAVAMAHRAIDMKRRPVGIGAHLHSENSGTDMRTMRSRIRHVASNDVAVSSWLHRKSVARASYRIFQIIMRKEALMKCRKQNVTRHQSQSRKRRIHSQNAMSV